MAYNNESNAMKKLFSPKIDTRQLYTIPRILIILCTCNNITQYDYNDGCFSRNLLLLRRISDWIVKPRTILIAEVWLASKDVFNKIYALISRLQATYILEVACAQNCDMH